MRNLLFATLLFLAAKSPAQPCQAFAQVEVVQGVECNLLSDGFTIYLPCVAPPWVYSAPLGAVFYIDYQLFSCASICLQGTGIYINCAISAGQTDSICTGSSVIIGSPAQANYAYQWAPVTGLSCNNCAQPIASPVYSQVYLRTAMDTLCPACPPLTEQYFVVVDSCVMAVSDLQKPDVLTLFPQPTTGVLYYAGAQPAYFEVFDARGVFIKRITQSDNDRFDISEVPEGVYFIRAFANKWVSVFTVLKM